VQNAAISIDYQTKTTKNVLILCTTFLEEKDTGNGFFFPTLFRTYKEDMSGVGSFSRDNRTLAISGFKRSGVSEVQFPFF
jgi:hypothetical protein